MFSTDRIQLSTTRIRNGTVLPFFFKIWKSTGRIQFSTAL